LTLWLFCALSQTTLITPSPIKNSNSSYNKYEEWQDAPHKQESRKEDEEEEETLGTETNLTSERS